ncbi:MAG: glycosyltransferase [Candidatus Latescibacteria bacterium]|nr:glycosyltransferase [Candidatus Latescibacterota bacterium]
MGKKKKKASRPRLSLCMIARDEAAFLDQCLGSVRGLADQLVVVDTGSADATAQVARQHGALVLAHPWQGDYAAARNLALEEASGDWVLVLDCDEVLARPDHPRLRRLLVSSGPMAYRLTTRNYTDQANLAGWVACRGEYPEERQYRGWFPTTKVRLWRNLPGIRFAGQVHELVEASVLALGGKLADCPVPVHHYGHTEKKRSPDQYLQAGEEKVRQQPGDLRALYELALAYRDAGRHAQALQTIAQVIAGLEEPGRPAALYLQEELALLVQADLLDRLGQGTEALQAYLRIAERFPHAYQAFNNAGSLLERQGRAEEALRRYQQGAALAPDNQVLRNNLARLQKRQQGGWRLSVCLIARDEEAVLPRCLESVRSVADELVVVDTGSTDRTAQIARQYGARLGSFAWCDDFAAARNAALDLATGEWILWLDADDYLAPQDQQQVRSLKEQTPDQAFCFTLVNEGGDRSSFRQIKMFPRHPEVRFERPVHEHVLAGLRRAGFPLRVAQVQVRHTGYATAEQVARKKRYYLKLMEDWLARRPGDWDICFRIGHTYYSEQDTLRARGYFARILAVGPQAVDPPSVFRLAAVFHARCLIAEGAWAEAAARLEEAVELQPDEVLANLSLGDARTKMGQYEAALAPLRRALDGLVDPHFPLDLEVIRYSAHFFLGQCYQGLGRSEEARAAFAAARQQAPHKPEAAQALEELARRAPAPMGEAGGENRLSLCMIVRDEAHRLGNCLESVRGLVDELVVVDTGSTDDTEEVARRYGAKLGYFAWCDDFAAARNHSLSLATGDWILWLDADDLLPAEYHAQIRHLLKRGRDKSYFFLLDDRGYENVSCLQMRLFPNLPGVRFEMPIHEQVTPSLARLGVEMVPTQVRVTHTGYPTPEVVSAKKDRYLKVMEQWLEGHPEDYIVRSHVALTYHTTGRLEEAVAAYRAIIDESTCLADRNFVVYTTALLFLGRTYLKLKDYPQALEFVEKAEEVDPDYLLTKLTLAETYIRLGRFAEAGSYAQAVLDSGPQHTFFPIDQRDLRYSALLLRAQAHQGLGEWDRAEDAYLQASQVQVPRRSEALGSLSQLHKSLGKKEKALQILEQARQVAPDNLHHLFNIGVLHLEEGRLGEAKEAFEAVLVRQPEHGPALLNLGFIAKHRGQVQEAEQLYRQVAALQPEGVEALANLGHLYLAEGRHAEAASTFAQVRSRDPRLLDINLGLLASLASQGQWDQALALEILNPFAEAQPVELGEQRAAARTFVRLGAVLVGRQLPKCAEFALAIAIALDAGCLEARRCLGQLFFHQGAYWKAIAQYEVVLHFQPRDAEVFRSLGDCYRKLGVEEAARMCYEQSRRAAAGAGPDQG